MKFAFIKENRASSRVKKMCQALKVSPSGYYAWLKRGESRRDKENRILLFHIKTAYENSRRSYGSPRITAELNDKRINCGGNRVARIMRVNGIAAKSKRKFKPSVNSKHNLPIYENLIGQNFKSDLPNRVWVSDITYIPTGQGWLYLAAVLDLYSRQIVGLSMSNRMTGEITADALSQAICRRSPQQGLICHSDRGSQYASREYQELLSSKGFLCSMSGKGNCYDNACMESFFHTMKTELVYFEKFNTRSEAKSKIFEYIEVFYNRQRRHSYLGYRSPVDFEKLGEAA